MTEARQTIVIGGGHNGLVCATYLARAGHDVLLLEARDEVGGMAGAVRFGEQFGAPAMAHLANAFHPDIYKELGLTKYGLAFARPAATVGLNDDGRHITLDEHGVRGEGIDGKDVQAWQQFRANMHAWGRVLEPMLNARPPRLKHRDFTDDMTLAKVVMKLRVGLGRDMMREFLRVVGMNSNDLLMETFWDERIRGLISADSVMGHHMGPRTPGTVLSLMQRWLAEQRGGGQQIEGGTPQLCKALSAAAEEAGVTVRTGALVKRITATRSGVQGVLLSTGERITSPCVVSALDARATFLQLLGAAVLDADFVRRVHQIRARGNVVRLHLGLTGLPNVAGLDSAVRYQRLLYAPSLRYVEHAFNHAKYGEYSPSPVLEMTVPTLDGSATAPQGHHVLSVLASFAPYDLKVSWEAGAIGFTSVILRKLEQLMPGLREQIVARDLLSPVMIEQAYGAPSGHWHHGEMSFDQSFMMRPVHGAAQYDTPVPGLYLCGASTHPGGGVTGVPGRNAARRVAELEKGR